jgi:ubiquinol oxidase
MRADIDLKKEQEATLSRPPRPYGFLARLLFLGMDLFYGKEMTLGKTRFLEVLARIPYQAWEIGQYRKLNRKYSDPAYVERSEDLIGWGREAQDSEFWHLEVVNEKMKRDGVRPKWFKDRFAPSVAAFKYNLLCRVLAFLSLKAALKLNADLEDHAEHEYMNYVKSHPELDEQPVEEAVVKKYGDFKTWGDVFRRLGLEERDHMNNSLKRCGRESEVVPYASTGG